MYPPYQQAYFLKSVVSLNDLPPDTGHEVAFIGRSNAGKSSALNTLCGQRQLARVSNTPGRTQCINYFLLDDPSRRLVDLPGYGFAKASKEAQYAWQGLIDDYLSQRQSLQGLIIVMDIRHPLQPADQKLLDFCQEIQMPVRILLSKADKLTRNQGLSTLRTVSQAASNDRCAAQIFSSLKRQGLDELVQQLDFWLGIERK